MPEQSHSHLPLGQTPVNEGNRMDRKSANRARLFFLLFCIHAGAAYAAAQGTGLADNDVHLHPTYQPTDLEKSVTWMAEGKVCNGEVPFAIRFVTNLQWKPSMLTRPAWLRGITLSVSTLAEGMMKLAQQSLKFSPSSMAYFNWPHNGKTITQLCVSVGMEILTTAND